MKTNKNGGNGLKKRKSSLCLSMVPCDVHIILMKVTNSCEKVDKKSMEKSKM